MNGEADRVVVDSSHCCEGHSLPTTERAAAAARQANRRGIYIALQPKAQVSQLLPICIHKVLHEQVRSHLKFVYQQKSSAAAPTCSVLHAGCALVGVA
jgi:hypothetical protein